MHIAVVDAGGASGYFGGPLARAREDATPGTEGKDRRGCM